MLHRKCAIPKHGHRPRAQLCKGPQQSELPKRCHRGNLTKPLYPRACRTVTLSATLAGRPQMDRALRRKVAAGAHNAANSREERGQAANHSETGLVPYTMKRLSYHAWFEVSAACRVHGRAAVPPWKVKGHAAAGTQSREPLWQGPSASAPAAVLHPPSYIGEC
jgi:hypothetical protein